MFNGASVQAQNSGALTITQGTGTLYLTPQYNGYTIIPTGISFTLNSSTGVVGPPTVVGLLGVSAGQFSIIVFNPSAVSVTITYTGIAGVTTYILLTKSVVVFGWSGTYLFP